MNFILQVHVKPSRLDEELPKDVLLHVVPWIKIEVCLVCDVIALLLTQLYFWDYSKYVRGPYLEFGPKIGPEEVCSFRLRFLE